MHNIVTLKKMTQTHRFQSNICSCYASVQTTMNSDLCSESSRSLWLMSIRKIAIQTRWLIATWFIAKLILKYSMRLTSKYFLKDQERSSISMGVDFKTVNSLKCLIFHLSWFVKIFSAISKRNAEILNIF